MNSVVNKTHLGGKKHRDKNQNNQLRKTNLQKKKQYELKKKEL